MNRGLEATLQHGNMKAFKRRTKAAAAMSAVAGGKLARGADACDSASAIWLGVMPSKAVLCVDLGGPLSFLVTQRQDDGPATGHCRWDHNGLGGLETWDLSTERMHRHDGSRQ